MTFTWLNKQGVRSDAGFELQFVDRFTMEYRQDGRTITLDIESGFLGANQPAILMSPDALNAWDDGAELLPTEQRQALQNVREALAFQGLGLSLE
jgi:hypothetical protein